MNSPASCPGTGRPLRAWHRPPDPPSPFDTQSPTRPRAPARSASRVTIRHAMSASGHAYAGFAHLAAAESPGVEADGITSPRFAAVHFGPFAGLHVDLDATVSLFLVAGRPGQVPDGEFLVAFHQLAVGKPAEQDRRVLPQGQIVDLLKRQFFSYTQDTASLFPANFALAGCSWIGGGSSLDWASRAAKPRLV